LLGGEIRLTSKPEEGSNFTLYLPLHYSGPSIPWVAPVRTVSGQNLARPAGALPIVPVSHQERIADDRNDISPDDCTALIVEDDPHYARILLGLARDKGFKGLVATRGREAITLARQYRPTVITLDIFLPDMLGWTVLNKLKLAPETRHIPVQIITVEEERRHGLSHGAFSYLVKPATTEDLESAFDRMKSFVAPRTKRLLVVEDNSAEQQSIVELLSHHDVEITTASSGREAFEALLDRPFDCCVLDLRLPDMSGFELLDKLQGEPSLREVPIVVFTGKQLSTQEQERLRTAARSVVLKDVRSPERLLDETALFLHRAIADLPEGKQQMLRQLHESNEALRGRRVLIVDDDARNIFALSIVLENQDMEVFSATNGRQAIKLIRETPELSVVLMDIMMPEMDGYQTMREIRKIPEFRALPILALTAKAMKGDREKCLEAGASDYIAKPVDTDQLLSLLRVWLHR
jgi:CheY-like chemotaxis protein